MNTDANDIIIEREDAAVSGTPGVSQVTVSITVSAKPLGGDAYIKMEEVFDFLSPVSPAEAEETRAYIAENLRTQVLNEAVKTAEVIRATVAATPRGNVSVHPVTAPSNTGAQTGQFVPSAGPAATVGVANGATPTATVGLQWASVKSKFGEGELRFVTTSSISSDELKNSVLAQIQTKWGINPAALIVWDNRVGPKGLEAGVPAGCVTAIKISKDAHEFVSPELHSAAIARSKFNADGTVYVWLTKEGEAALKYGALGALKAGA
jgi:hypothetical protein